ncbi:MAG: hypothetical protein ABIT01_01335 [Thermoanaerobaculia bacterium]
MHLFAIGGRPYAVINGKDYAVYRWFDPGRSGPVFVQVAGRTALAKEDLPNSDWVVVGGRDGSHRIATAWRHPWFDYRVDAARKLAFLAGSTPGSLFLALQYVARRFGAITEPAALAVRARAITENWDVPGRRLTPIRDQGLTESALVVLDLPSHFDGDDAARLLAC